jgi:hypothetical protein
MDANSRKKPSQLEINDLIAEAVVNAEARRNQAEELLSDEELATVKGGISLGPKPIITWGYKRVLEDPLFPALTKDW